MLPKIRQEKRKKEGRHLSLNNLTNTKKFP